MTSLIKKRNKYYKWAWMYEKRREDLRVKLGLQYNLPPTKAVAHLPEYKKRAAIFTKKIKQWKYSLRQIDKRRDSIVFLEKSVKLFTGSSVRGNAKVVQGAKLAKSIYYKFGIENGLRGKDLMEHIGGKRELQPMEYRRSFTQSFHTNPENKELWLRFKKFYERRLEAEANRFISTKKTA